MEFVDTSHLPEVPDGLKAYLARGFSLIPVYPRDKKPAIGSWKKYQTEKASETQVRQWCLEIPNGNWGIVTGRISGVVVLDFDKEEALVRAKELGLPRTPTVKTPRGHHSYFRHPGTSLRNRAGAIDGMDVRADGGYVVAPPSK